MDGGEGKGREYVCGDTRVCGCDEGSAGAVADVGDAGTGVFCGENGGDGEWVLQGETGEWDQWVCAGGGIKKKTGFGSVFVGKSEERFFVEQGIPEGWSEEKFRRKVVECAKGYLGCQYRWGGKAADGIDCSGVVFMVYLMNGVLIWRDADIREGYPMKAIWREGEEMCLVEERAKAGDLLFWRGHVGMYLGDGRYLHCTGHERVFGCRVNSLRRGDEDFREDLAEALKVVGSVFREISGSGKLEEKSDVP